MIKEHLRTYLLADATLADAIADRVYYGFAPEDAAVYPYLVLRVISTPRVRSLKGPSGLAHPRVQVTLVHSDPIALADLAATLRRRIDGDNARAHPLTVGGVTVQDMRVDDEGDDEDASPGNADLREYAKRFDVIIWHNET